MFCFMEVSVFMSLAARSKDTAVFKRRVECPDAFEYDAFVRVMKSVFGNSIVIEFLVV